MALLHARRCGWFSGQQLGMYMLERARDTGVRLIEGRVERVETAGGRVTGVEVSGREARRTIGTRRFVNAAGPFLKEWAGCSDSSCPCSASATRRSRSTIRWAWCRGERR